MSIKIDRLQGLLDHARKLHGNIKALRGLAQVKLRANEHHKRVHMVTVRSSCAAVKGNPFSWATSGLMLLPILVFFIP